MVTDWDEYRKLNLSDVIKAMEKPPYCKFFHMRVGIGDVRAHLLSLRFSSVRAYACGARMQCSTAEAFGIPPRPPPWGSNCILSVVQGEH
jgi:hypothetical protein